MAAEGGISGHQEGGCSDWDLFKGGVMSGIETLLGGKTRFQGKFVLSLFAFVYKPPELSFGSRAFRPAL